MLRDEPLDENNTAIRPHCASAVAQDVYALLVIPIVKDDFEDVEVGFRDAIEEIARNGPAPRRQPQLRKRGFGARHHVRATPDWPQATRQ